MNTNIFKSYDIRGIYPTDLNEKDAYAIGQGIVALLKTRNIAIGRDARPSSRPLFDALVQGVNDAGSNVLDMGSASTPMVYFASQQRDVDGSISITASHNPPEWNGFKITKKNALPVGLNTGLKEVRDFATTGKFTKNLIRGILVPYASSIGKYNDYFSTFWKLGDAKFNVVIDTANAMGTLELPVYTRMKDNLTVTPMYDDLSHPFSVHEANPLKTETLDDLRAKVKELHADIGIAYDGDADRIGFVDETGTPVPMDFITAIVSFTVLKQHPGSTVLYDLRSSMSVKEAIEKNGGIAHECMCGHANIKKQMAEEHAVFAGELSGHYYFKENANAESGTFAAILLLNYMAETKKKLSELVAEVKKYYHSGEINSTVTDIPAVLEKLKEKYKDGNLSELDGIKISYPDWWFNVRASNTEPLLRLNMEAKTTEMMEQKRDELLALIRN